MSSSTSHNEARRAFVDHFGKVAGETFDRLAKRKNLSIEEILAYIANGIGPNAESMTAYLEDICMEYEKVEPGEDDKPGEDDEDEEDE